MNTVRTFGPQRCRTGTVIQISITRLGAFALARGDRLSFLGVLRLITTVDIHTITWRKVSEKSILCELSYARYVP